MQQWPYRSGKYLTKYERAALKGERVRQLEANSPPMVPLQPGDTAEKIALREIQTGTIPIGIKRTLPDGTIEIIPVNALIRDERS